MPCIYVHYAAAKAGVPALSVGLSKELAPQGIHVNCVEPGTVWTDFHQGLRRPAKVAEVIPLGRAECPGKSPWQSPCSSLRMPLHDGADAEVAEGL